MRAIVTGGAGFIGSTVVDSLQSTVGADVLVVDDLSSGSLDNLSGALERGARFVRLDIRDAGPLSAAFRDFRPAVVFHLAAQVDVRRSMAAPEMDAAINVIGSVNVFSAAHEVGADRVVSTSTGGAIYGETGVLPTPETVAPRPQSAYGLSKHAAEQYARWFGGAKGLDVITLRYGNVYGPRQNPHGDAGVIARFCKQALEGTRPVIFGDGTQTRDFVYVGDVVAANIAAGVSGRLPHDVYNIGTGIEISVIELVDVMARTAGLHPGDWSPEHAPARPGEVLRSCLDVRRARHELRLPPPTTLEEGLRHTLGWVRGICPGEGSLLSG